jgi:hypothetical protein
MSPRMSQSASLVLLLARTVATAVGMMAWGPIELQPKDHQFANMRPWLGVPQAFNTLACAPLLAAGAWGLVALRNGGWPAALRAPCSMYFACAVSMGVSSAAYHLDPSDARYVVSHAFGAGAMTMLGLLFLAERVDGLFGSAPAILGGIGIVGFATLWWFAGEWTTGHGDLRALVFLECLPVFLLPSGALCLPGRFTRRADWLAMMLLYLVARSAGLMDAPLLDPTGGVGGHALMHLFLAGVAGCIAYRAGVASGARPLVAASASDPTQRRTSLSTSS